MSVDVMGIRTKVIFVPVVMLLLAVSVNVALTGRRFRSDYSRAMRGSIREMADDLKRQMERLFELGFKLHDISGFEAQCREELLEHPELSYAAIIDPRGEVMTETSRSGVELRWNRTPPKSEENSPLWVIWDEQGEGHYALAVPIKEVSGRTAAWSVVAFPRQELDGRIHELVVWSAGVAIGSTAITVVLLWGALSALVTRPLSRLVGAIREIHTSGDLTKEVRINSRDELAELARSFNGMIHGIRSRDSEIHRHLHSLQDAHDKLEQRVRERTADLTRANEDLQQQIALRREAEQKREQMHAELVETSRKAGMADVATGVLHNVGNVLNSVNVSAQIIQDNLRASQLSNLMLVSEMIEQQRDPAAFLTQDERGRQVPQFICKLSRALDQERRTLAAELNELAGSVEHIKEIVNMQQSLARTAGVNSQFAMSELFEDAIKINQAGLGRHGVEVVRDFAGDATIESDRHKALQILINLISNAKYALTYGQGERKLLTLRIRQSEGFVEAQVIDNGAGIESRNMQKVFTFGFTTKKGGHGFGLHSSALAAREIGGSITVQSDGPGKGATFTLCLPLNQGVAEKCLPMM